jgi:hypothetical protein
VHIIPIKKLMKMTRSLHFDSLIPLTSKPGIQDQNWRKNWLDDTEEKIEQEQNFKASKTRTIKKTKMKNKHKGFKDRKKKE